MKTASALLIAFGLGSSAFAQPPAAAPPTSVGAALDREVSLAERQLIGVVEAMPEAKFNFTPESLDIKGSAFKGVYTFAGLVKHLAAANYFLWGGAGGDPIPANITGVKGPEGMTSRAEIIALLKASFASGHHAAAALTPENSLDMVSGPGGQKVPRVFGISFGVAHAYDEYGQMVEYLRMCGIVPPASAPR
jgi:DinB family protein